MSISDKITNAGRTVSQTFRNLTDSSALQREMNAEKRNIQQMIAEIGRLYYERYKDDPGAEFFAEIESITASERRIEELQDEIQSVQARKPDLVQASENPRKVRPSAMVCMQCGASYSDVSQTFCAACGQKLTAQYPSAAAAYLAPDQTASDVQSRPVQPSLTKPADIVIPDIPAKNEQPEQPAEPGQPSGELPADEETTAAKPRFCTKCGAKADEDSLFCARCGNKLA